MTTPSMTSDSKRRTPKHEAVRTAMDAGQFINNSILQDESSIANLQVKFDSLESARNHVQSVAQMYRASYPGRDTYASNHGVDTSLRSLAEGKSGNTWGSLRIIYAPLVYRLSICAYAAELLKLCDIPLPNGRVCTRTDIVAFTTWVRHSNRKDVQEKWAFCNSLVSKTAIIPLPDSTQGAHWHKAKRYLSMALTLMPGLDTVQQLQEQLAKLETAASEQLKVTKHTLEHEPRGERDERKVVGYTEEEAA
jgi:hypothetical protein